MLYINFVLSHDSYGEQKKRKIKVKSKKCKHHEFYQEI